MVYGMGGYRFGDFARVGVPLTLVMIVVTMIVVPIAWPLR
jgi:di/tricarboxylate transporter